MTHIDVGGSDPNALSSEELGAAFDDLGKSREPQPLLDFLDDARHALRSTEAPEPNALVAAFMTEQEPARLHLVPELEYAVGDQPGAPVSMPAASTEPALVASAPDTPTVRVADSDLATASAAAAPSSTSSRWRRAAVGIAAALFLFGIWNISTVLSDRFRPEVAEVAVERAVPLDGVTANEFERSFKVRVGDAGTVRLFVDGSRLRPAAIVTGEGWSTNTVDETDGRLAMRFIDDLGQTYELDAMLVDGRVEVSVTDLATNAIDRTVHGTGGTSVDDPEAETAEGAQRGDRNVPAEIAGGIDGDNPEDSPPPPTTTPAPNASPPANEQPGTIPAPTSTSTPEVTPTAVRTVPTSPPELPDGGQDATPTGTPSPASTTAAETTVTQTPTPSSVQNTTSTTTPTATPTATAVPLATSIPTATAIPTAEPSATPLPTGTPVPTTVPTPTATPVPTATPLPTAVPTATPVPTSTPTPTPVPAVLDGLTIEVNSGIVTVTTTDQIGLQVTVTVNGPTAVNGVRSVMGPDGVSATITTTPGTVNISAFSPDGSFFAFAGLTLVNDQLSVTLTTTAGSFSGIAPDGLTIEVATSDGSLAISVIGPDGQPITEIDGILAGLVSPGG